MMSPHSVAASNQLTGLLVLPSGVQAGRLSFGRVLQSIMPMSELHSLEPQLEAEGRYIVAGFIDTHVHGGGGGDAMDGVDGVETLCRFHAGHGTTTILPTTMTAPWNAVVAALRGVVDVRARQQIGAAQDRAQVVGAHLEGPFISPQRLGAQPNFSLMPTPERVGELLELGVLGAVTLAPELEGATEAARTLARAGVRVGVGHTRASAEAVWDFLEKLAADGARLASTHTFNAMGGISARDAGVAGALLAHPAPFYEIIADLHHVDPINIRMLHALAPDRLILITDAMRAAGMPDGDSELGGQRVRVQAGRATLADGTLAGSVLTMAQGFRNLVQGVGLSLCEASRVASANPARSLGLSDRGELRVGQRADIVVLDADLKVLEVYVGGQRLE